MDGCYHPSWPDVHQFAYVCDSCGQNHSFHVPQLGDFDVPSHERSSRLHFCFLGGTGFWYFENYRKELFLRTDSYSSTWYYQPTSSCRNQRLCEHYGSLFEKLYGIFIRKPENKEEERMFHGYETIVGENRSYYTSFDDKSFVNQRYEPVGSQIRLNENNEKRFSCSSYDVNRDESDAHLNACKSNSNNSILGGTQPLTNSQYHNENCEGTSRSVPEASSGAALNGIKSSMLNDTQNSKTESTDLPVEHLPDDDTSGSLAEEPFLSLNPCTVEEGLEATEENMKNQPHFVSSLSVDCERTSTKLAPVQKNDPGDKMSYSANPVVCSQPTGTFHIFTEKIPETTSKIYNFTKTVVDKIPEKESFVTSVKNLFSGKSMKVFSELQRKFKFLYECLNWRKDFPIYFVFERMEDQFPFELKIQYRQGRSMINSDEIFSKSDSKKEIVIYGLPGFGKSTLCYMMTFHWAFEFPEMKAFGLCVYCSLPEMDFGRDFSMEIVFLCQRTLNNRDVELKTLLHVLNKYSDKIVLLLDGYDKLSENDQKQVMHFLQTKPIFSKSTFVVTTGPSCKPSFIEYFDRRVAIGGCTSSYIIHLLRSMQMDGQFIRIFNKRIHVNKLDLLQELSPFFAAWIAKTVRGWYNRLSRFDSLYSLLDIVVQEVISSKPTSIIDRSELLQIFGKMCFENLVKGTFVFSSRALKDAFGKELKLLVDCNFLYPVGKGNEITLWTVTSKVLQVFFATMYLRNTWSFCTDQFTFLQEVFCCNGCTGDYVTTAPNRVYYVGLIPEIVLQLNDFLQVEKSTFQMYYDVDRIEHSQAFDSVNLLLRIHDRFLPRFRFQQLESEDPQLKDHFRFLNDLLNSFSSECFLFEHHFYKNIVEDKFFVKMELKDSEKPNDAFFCVLREKTNLLVDRLYLDFPFSKLMDYYPVIKSVLSLFLTSIELYSNMMYQPFEEFVLNLVQAFLDCSVLRAAAVTCSANGHNLDTAYKNNVTFQVFSSSMEGRVIVNREKYGDLGNVYHNELNEHEFFINKGDFMDFLRGMKENSPIQGSKESSLGPRITINIW